jgi:hypothetical protein
MDRAPARSWSRSRQPVSVTLTNSPCPHSPNSHAWDKSLLKAVALQRQFLVVAGWPDCRQIYEK